MNYTHWINRFKANRHDRPEPLWQSPLLLSEKKRRALAKSLSEYQLGDGGGPCCLVARDAEKARGVCPEARELIDLWFAEEREHSRLLGDALRRIGGKFVTSTPAFELFTFVRRLIGVQFEMLVLLIVEIVSTGYYRLIAAHCDDQPIAAMCALILRDEAGHIAFHRDRLAARPAPFSRTAWNAWFRLLAWACTTFLWLGHGRWLGAIGATHGELAREVRAGTAAFLSSLARAQERSCPADLARPISSAS